MMNESEKKRLFREAEEQVAEQLKAQQAPLHETISNMFRGTVGLSETEIKVLTTRFVEAIWEKFFVQPIDAERRMECARKEFEILQTLRVNPSQAGFLARNNVRSQDVIVLSAEETRAIRSRWEEIYIGDRGASVMLHKCEACDHGGVSGYESFNWHIFSYGCTPAQRIESGTKEEDEKRKTYLQTRDIANDKLILLWEPCHYLALELPTPIVKSCRLDTDLYVAPRSLAWTFVNTHENLSFYAQTENGVRQDFGTCQQV